MRAHMGLKYQCEYCGKAYSNPVQLKYRIFEHTGVYRFKCDDCGKGFNLEPEFKNTSKYTT